MVLAIIPVFFILLFLLNKNFVYFRKKEEEQEFNKSKKKDRSFLLLTRTLIVLLVLIALASPYSEKSITVPGDASLLILADNSTSFDLFDKSIAPELASKLKGKLPVNMRYIASGDVSAIGDGILNNMKGEDNLLVITDGNNNNGRVLGDVVLFASSLNTSISTINIDPIENDAGVKIIGPSVVVVDESNTFEVKVNEVGDVGDYLLEVYVDGEKVASEQNIKSKKITKKFSEGYHKIWAEINVNDHFQQNNEYYKSIKVIPPPKILFISQKTSPLLSGLTNLYDVRLEESLPQDISNYHTVIINDIKGDTLSNWIPKLTEYVADGNGLVVIGGESSYDKGYYQKPSYLIETLLPVKIGIPEMEGKSDANIMLLIDISGTAGLGFTSTSGSSKLDVQKALALSVLTTIRTEDTVGILAFNDVSHLISPLSTLSEKESDMIQKIKTLQASGGTLVFQGLRRAEYMLDGALGSKNIVVISDGLDAAEKAALDLTKVLAKKGVKVFTVGIGEGTNEQFLRSMADIGNGLYLQPDETQNLRLFFGEEAEQEEETFSLIILDQNHWITKGELGLSATLTGNNYVVPKSGSRAIVATSSGSPIITVGSFGLGRVVAISTDDGGKWAADLLTKENSKIVTRTINYAIGDPGRNLDFDVTIDDATLGKPSQIKLVSKKIPKVDTPLSKIGDTLYIGSFSSDKVGFSEILGATVATNYNEEYLDLGLNPEFKELVALTNGKVFDKDDIEEMVST
ncbi:MAG: vWA domain-containing protein, partial [Nanoarchaeota archaeon]